MWSVNSHVNLLLQSVHEENVRIRNLIFQKFSPVILSTTLYICVTTLGIGQTISALVLLVYEAS